MATLKSGIFLGNKFEHDSGYFTQIYSFVDLLNEVTKLKQLSLVSLAANSSVLEYKQMMNELSLDTPRALEDLILKTVFAGLVEGQLDQQKGVFEVQFAMGRDIGPNDVDIMLAKLKDWLEHSTTLKEELKTHQTRANAKVVSDSKLEEVITPLSIVALSVTFADPLKLTAAAVISPVIEKFLEFSKVEADNIRFSLVVRIQ